MTVTSVPCRNPQVCGVKTHLSTTTNLACMRSSTSKAGSLKIDLSPENNLSAAASRMKADGIKLSERGESILKDVRSGNESEVSLNTVDGTEMIIAVNVETNFGGMYESSGNPLAARIKTASGLKVYAFAAPHEQFLTFRDGHTQKSWINPMDENLNDLSSELTRSEFRVLENAVLFTETVGSVDAVNPNHDMSSEAMDRELIRSLLEYAGSKPSS